MPELPEVEVIRRGLLGLRGLEVVGLEAPPPGPNTPIDLELLTRVAVGKKLESIERRGKYLLFGFTGGGSVLFHLKMTGKLLVGSDFPEQARHHRLIISFAGGEKLLFNDVRRFGICISDPREIARRTCGPELGPDPLSPGFSGDFLFGKAKTRRTKLKAFLLDQKIAPGLGNIYVNESMHLAGLHPETPVNTIDAARWNTLADSVRRVLEEAIEHGGTTLGRGWSNYHNAKGEPGRFQERLSVYGRQGRGCPRCGSEIARAASNNRATYYCPKCQEA